MFCGCGGGEESRKIQWVHQDNVCLDWCNGSLGVRLVRKFNVSLFIKMVLKAWKPGVGDCV